MEIQAVVTPIVAAALAGTGSCGLVAVVSPKTFSGIAAFASRRIETSQWFEWFDKEFDIDEYILRHTRLFGLFTIATVLCATWALT
jgi:hypothetical protein